jgi:hypothetical protein
MVLITGTDKIGRVPDVRPILTITGGDAPDIRPAGQSSLFDIRYPVGYQMALPDIR